MTKRLHFAVQGEFITNLAREKLFVDKDLAGAIRILRSALCSDQLSSDEQLMICLQILHGAASIKGVSDTEEYGIIARDDIEERPTDLSSISQLIADMAEENARLKKENYDAMLKISFLAEEMSDYQLSRVNGEYYNEYGEPMFSDMAIPAWMKQDEEAGGMNDILEDFLTQRHREEAVKSDEEPICDYGWLEPNGTFYPVGWAEHDEWASDWLNENKPFKENAGLYWRVDSEGKRHHIFGGDVLVYSLGWILLDSPHRGIARVTKDPARDMTKAQKEFLYDYYIERGRNEEANALYQD